MNKNAIVKPVIGMLLGAGVVLTAGAKASQSGNWFSSLFSTGGSSAAASALPSSLAAVDAAMNQKLADDQKNCDDVGIGAAIKTAMGAHTEMASATPNVESLFDVDQACFASVSQMIDLSYTIPSLSSILAAAQDAVTRYAKKKVCSAVGKVSGMVTSPINQSIGGWGQLGSRFTDINGMANSAVAGSLSTLDPQLGSAYKPAPASTTYTMSSNSFAASQTTFSTGENVQQQVVSSQPATEQPQASQAPQAESQSFTGWASSLFNN